MSVCSTLTTLSENYASSALISFSAATTTNSSNSFQISFPIIHLAHPTLLTHLTHVQYITLPYSSPIRILNSSPILGSITASLAIQHPLPRTPNDPSACQAQDLDCLVIWKHWLFFFGELSQAWCFFFTSSTIGRIMIISIDESTIGLVLYFTIHMNIMNLAMLSESSIFYTGWWFGTWILFFHLLGISLSQLTFICFREVGQPPTSICLICLCSLAL